MNIMIRSNIQTTQLRVQTGLVVPLKISKPNIFPGMQVTFHRYLVKIFTVKVSLKQLAKLSMVNTNRVSNILLKIHLPLRMPPNSAKKILEI